MEAIVNSPITLAILVANIVLSVLAFQNEAFMKKNLFVVGAILRRREVHRLVSSGFLHLNVMHLFVNMYVLIQIGPQLEAWMGPVHFTILYTVSLIGGSLWSLMENRRNLLYSALGASGATSGLILAFCLAAPNAIFFFPPGPAWLLAVGYFLVTAVLARQPNTRIGHDAHMGGMLFGAGYTLIYAPYVFPRFVNAINSTIAGLF